METSRTEDDPDPTLYSKTPKRSQLSRNISRDPSDHPHICLAHRHRRIRNQSSLPPWPLYRTILLQRQILLAYYFRRIAQLPTPSSTLPSSQHTTIPRSFVSPHSGKQFTSAYSSHYHMPTPVLARHLTHSQYCGRQLLQLLMARQTNRPCNLLRRSILAGICQYP